MSAPEPTPGTGPAYHAVDNDSGDYDYLKGPDGFECFLGESEDRSWSRDGAPVVDRLNEQHAEMIRLRAAVQRERQAAAAGALREAARDLDDGGHWKAASMMRSRAERAEKETT